MENSQITKPSKMISEWLIIFSTTIVNLIIVVLGLLLFVTSGNIFDEIFGFLMILTFLIILYLELRFYLDSPWGWFFLLISHVSILVVTIFAGYGRISFELINGFYLVIFKGFTNILIQGFGGITTLTLEMWFNNIFINEDSFLLTKGLFLGLLFSLIGIYWSVNLLSEKYSEREVRSLQRKSGFLLVITLLAAGIGIILSISENNLIVLLSGLIGSLGSILVLILSKFSLKEKYIANLRLILIWGTIVVIAILTFNILLAFTIIISAITINSLRSNNIRHKFDVLRTAEQQEEQTAITFILPTVAVVCGIVLIPIIWIILASFFNVGLENVGPGAKSPDFVGFYNYTKLFNDPEFFTATITSILYTIFGTLGSVMLGLVAALLLNRSIPGRGFIRSVMLFPYIASTVAMVLLWTWALDEVYGLVNYFLFGINQGLYEPWIDQTPWAFIIVVVFEIWKYFPFAMLMILAQLQAIPEELYEAADIDGASDTQKFWHITLPELRYVLGVVILLRFIWTFNKFDDVYLFTTGSIETGTLVLPIYIFDKVFTGVLFRVSEAAAVAVVLFLALLAFSAVFGKKVLKW